MKQKGKRIKPTIKPYVLFWLCLIMFLAGCFSASAANQPPTIGNLNGDSVSFTIGSSGVVLDSGSDATVTDLDSADFNGGNVTVGITANRVMSEDQLLIGSVGSITTSGSNVVHDATTIGTYTGGTGTSDLIITLNSNATPARVQVLVRAIQYNNNNASTVSTAARTVRLTLDDGDGGSSNSSNQDVTVSFIRAPIIDLDGDNSSGNTSNGYNGSFVEGGGAVAVTDSDTTISDDGNTHNSLTVTLTARPDGDGVESVSSTVANGATVGADVVSVAAYVPATGVLQFTAAGGDGDGFLNNTTMTTLMASVRYNNTSQAPNTADRNIDFVAVDSSAFTGATSTAVISVTAVNDPPAFTGLDGTPAYTEGGAPVVLDANVTVADAELDAANSYNGGTLTLVRNGGANANEQFSESGTLSALTEGSPFNLGAGDIGTVTTNSGGTLVLTFNASATSANVDTVLQSIAYSNSSDAPASSVQIDWTFSDGNGGTQGTGGPKTATGSTIVSVTAVNDAPTFIGTPIITGTAKVGQTLELTDTATYDAEGDSVSLSYQWKADGVDIINSISATYTLTKAEINKLVSCIITADDGNGGVTTFTTAERKVVDFPWPMFLAGITHYAQDVDNDLDGYTENQGDCNDNNSTIFPGAIEKCSDGVDQDCNGRDKDCLSLSLTSVENRLLELINIERNAAGRPTLVRAPGLDRIISWHVHTMSEDKFLNHTDENGRRGEARARYYSGDSSIRCVELIQWWGGTPSGDVHYTGYFNSPAHHSGYMEEGLYNLGPTTHVGVAVFDGTGPIGSQYESRNGSYSGVFLCDKNPNLVIDPFSEN